MKGKQHGIESLYSRIDSRVRWWFWIGIVCWTIAAITSPRLIVNAATLIRANQLSLGDTFAFTGSPAVTVTNAGVFLSNIAMNEYLTSLLNGISLTTEFGITQGGNFATDAIAGGTAIPASSTIHQSDGIAGYATTSADSASRTKANAAGGYFQCRNLANNSACWGINPLLQDVAGLTGHSMTGIELDMNLYGSPTFFKGIYLTGLNGGGVMPATGTGFEIATPYKFNLGFVIDRASATGGIQLNDTLSTNPSPSQNIQFVSHDSGGVSKNASIQGDSSGNLQFQPSAGGSTYLLNSGGGFQYAATTFASLGTPANGIHTYCSDCTVANPCASGGTGAFAKRLNGAWVCN